MAQCSAVAPSFCAALTSAFFSMSRRTAALSPRMAASATALFTPGAPRTGRIVAATSSVAIAALSATPSALLDCGKLVLAIANRVLADAEFVENRQQVVAGRSCLGRVRV